MSADVERQRAADRARTAYQSTGFRNAYLAGAVAAIDGRPLDACPYDSRAGWKAWRIAWRRGYESVGWR